MRLVMFRGFGGDGIGKVEREVNDWLASNKKASVVKTETATTSVGNLHEEIYQCVVVSVWYEPRGTKPAAEDAV